MLASSFRGPQRSRQLSTGCEHARWPETAADNAAWCAVLGSCLQGALLAAYLMNLPLPCCLCVCVCTRVQIDWFMSAEQEASTEALTHRWDPSGQAAVTRLEAFLEQVSSSGTGVGLECHGRRGWNRGCKCGHEHACVAREVQIDLAAQCLHV